MKFILLSLLLVTACSSHQPKPRAKYDKDLVCSLAALEYLKPSGKTVKADHDTEAIRTEIVKITPSVKKCYEAELSNPAVTFRELNLCYVVGTDKKGKIEFSNFYSNEENLTKDFLKCLNKKKNRPDLKQFKSVKIAQPFRLYPAN